MTRAITAAALPLYLFLCLLLGGSGQGVWRNAILQLLAIPLIGWAVIGPSRARLGRAARSLLVLAVLLVMLIVVQLIPLPPAVWGSLPGRQALADGYAALGLDLPWLPLSLAPYDSLSAALALLPPLAVLLCLLTMPRQDERWLSVAILAGASASVLLGALQVASGGDGLSHWYLYPITNDGAVGFFANRNHMGTLLLVSIPFAAAFSALPGAKPAEQGRTVAIRTAGAALLLVVLVGLGLNGSLAATALAIPVLLASAPLLPSFVRFRQVAMGAVALGLVVAVAVMTSSPIRQELLGADRSSIESRKEIWSLTARAAADSFPAGTGLGSFKQVFRTYEDPAQATATYVNHAHNDFLEVALELGLPGIMLVAGFLLWWLVHAARAWKWSSSSGIARAATIASAAVLAHSMFDYPLRTAAIAATFAACLAILGRSLMQRGAADESDLGRARHHRIG